MSRLVERDDCERCGEPTAATSRLCPDCVREVRKARGDVL